MLKKLFARVGVAAFFAAAMAMAAPALAQVGVKDSSGANQNICTINVSGLQYPCHVIYGTNGSSPKALQADTSGNLQVNVQSSVLPSGAALDASLTGAQAAPGNNSTNAFGIQGVDGMKPISTSTVVTSMPATAPTAQNQTAPFFACGTYTCLRTVTSDLNGNPQDPTTVAQVGGTANATAPGASDGATGVPLSLTLTNRLRTESLNVDSGGSNIANSTYHAMQTYQVGSCTPYHLANGTGASSNATLVATGAHVLCDIMPENTTGTTYFLKLYDTATTPTCTSSTNLKHVFPIFNTAGFDRIIALGGETFTNGIGFCVVGGGGDTDGTSAAAGIYIEASYR